jgi:hypothetical protein
VASHMTRCMHRGGGVRRGERLGAPHTTAAHKEGWACSIEMGGCTHRGDERGKWCVEQQRVAQRRQARERLGARYNTDRGGKRLGMHRNSIQHRDG